MTDVQPVHENKIRKTILRSSLRSIQNVSSGSEIFDSSVQAIDEGFDWIKTPKSRSKKNKSVFSVEKLSDLATGGKYIPSALTRVMKNCESPASKPKSRKSCLLPTPAAVKTLTKKEVLVKPTTSTVIDIKQELKGSKKRNVAAWLASAAAQGSPITPPMGINGDHDECVMDAAVEEVLLTVYGPNWKAKTGEKKTGRKKDEPLSKANELLTTSKNVRRRIFDAPSPANGGLGEKDMDDLKTNRKTPAKSMRRKRKFSNENMSDDESQPMNDVKLTPAPRSQPAIMYTPKTPRRTFLASLSVTTPTSIGHPEAQQYKINFKKMKDELCTRLYKLYNTEVFNNQLPEDLQFTWNPKMRGTAGFCYNKRRQVKGVIVRTFRLALSPKVLDRADRLRDTLIHELCHAAAWVLDGTVNGHGPVWRAWADKARVRFPELPVIKRCHNYTIETKFTYRCVGCGYSINRQTKSIDIERKRCGYCVGKLELLYNKKKKGNLEAPEFETTRTLKTPNQYALFVKENYSRIKGANPSLKRPELMRLVGAEYKKFKSKALEE